MSNDIHIVFRLLNFLKNYKDLLPIDELILIRLASHSGEKGIFPKQKTIASEVKKSVRYIKERLKHLKKIGLISSTRKSNKTHYNFDCLDSIGEPQITLQENMGDPQITREVIHSSPSRGSTVHTNNKLNNPLNKSDRVEPENPDIIFYTKATFSYTHAEQETAIQRGFDVQQCFNKFWIYITSVKGMVSFKRTEWEEWFKREKGGNGIRKGNPYDQKYL